jgi:hypothetical protein
MVLPVTMPADVVYNPLDFASVNAGIGSDTRHIESCVGQCVKMKFGFLDIVQIESSGEFYISAFNPTLYTKILFGWV